MDNANECTGNCVGNYVTCDIGDCSTIGCKGYTTSGMFIFCDNCANTKGLCKGCGKKLILPQFVDSKFVAKSSNDEIFG